MNLEGIAIRAALFDLDGTLVHTHIDFDRMHREICALAESVGVKASALDGKHILEAVDEAVRRVGGESGADLRKSMWGALEQIENDGCSNPSLVPGADAMLDALGAEGVKIGVVTRNCRTVSEALLSAFDLRADVLLTRDDVPNTKPDPRHLLEALRLLDRHASESVMVGDHWLDILAGRNAGSAVTIGLLGERDSSWFETYPPTYMVKDLNRALDLFSDG